ncbi:MAG: hypothetical protein GYB18_14555 [Oceanospirillales bacterium]|nr:hypothetical protein [Oceanospirillales bacterium]
MSSSAAGPINGRVACNRVQACCCGELYVTAAGHTMLSVELLTLSDVIGVDVL